MPTKTFAEYNHPQIAKNQKHTSECSVTLESILLESISNLKQVIQWVSVIANMESGKIKEKLSV